MKSLFLDTDGDGLYDLLNVTLSLDAEIAGSAQLSAVLQGADGTLVDDAVVSFQVLAPGSATVDVLFSGERIRASSVDGPYVVTGVATVLDAEPEHLVVSADVHETASYMWTEFGAPAVGSSLAIATGDALLARVKMAMSHVFK